MFEDSHSEREGMISLEPTMVGVPALGAWARDQADGLLGDHIYGEIRRES